MARSKSDRFWLAGLVSALLYFATFEGQAYRTHNPDATLTYFSRRALGIAPRHWRRYGTVPTLWCACLWIACHLSWNVWGIPVRRP